MDYSKITAGAVAVSESLKVLDAAKGINVLPTHLFITEASKVEVVIRVDGVEHVNFSDTVTPGPAGAASLYVRTLIRSNIDPADAPTDPAVERAARLADGITPTGEAPADG